MTERGRRVARRGGPWLVAALVLGLLQIPADHDLGGLFVELAGICVAVGLSAAMLTWFDKRSTSTAPLTSTTQNVHSVVVHYSLTGDQFGIAAEREAVFALEDRVEAAIDDQTLGELDGNEFGGGEAVLYCYGPDAGHLFAGIEDVLRSFPARPAYAILRYGAPDDPGATEKRIDL